MEFALSIIFSESTMMTTTVTVQYCIEDGVDRIMIMLMMTLDGLVVERGGGCRESLITVLSRFSPWPSTLHCDQDDHGSS